MYKSIRLKRGRNTEIEEIIERVGIIKRDTVHKDKLKKKLEDYRKRKELILEYMEYKEYNRIYPNIKKLLLIGSGDLDKIGTIFPNLEELRLTVCKEYTILPILLNLKSLSLDRCNIVEIKNFPKLEFLSCLYCKKLCRVYCIPRIKEINIIGSNVVFDDVKKMQHLEKLLVNNDSIFGKVK